MTITLREALQRILGSTATNEGPDAKCSVPALAGQTRYVRDFLATGHLAPDAIVSLQRSVRNWQIVSPDGIPILRSHPWDDTPNIAKLGTRPDPAHIESLIAFNARLQELANEAERLRQFVIAQSLWQMVAVVASYTSQPVENAIRESQRLAAVVAALVPTPKPRA